MTTHSEKVKAAMELYHLVVDAHHKQLTEANRSIASILREILQPVLHRWGMGMKNGGTLVYANPNIEGPDEVIMPKDYDYVLGELHPELQGALWEVDTAPYEFTLHDYMDDIDLPLPDSVHYVWLTTLGNQLGIVGITASWGHEPSDVLYYGPVTREFVGDVGTTGDDLDVSAVLDSLPKYRAGDMEWERVIDSIPAPPPNEECTQHTLYYDTNSLPIRDVDIEATVSRLHYQDIYTSTGLVVEAVLCHMYEGKLPPTRILIEGQPMEFDEDGVVKYWAGFPTYDYTKRLLLSTLGKWNTGGGSNG